MNRFSLYMLCAFAPIYLIGCFTDSTDSDEQILPNVEGISCAELTPEQKVAGDALVAEANQLIVSDLDIMMEALDRGDLDVAKTAAPEAALAKYNQALAVAPGHCSAVFGKTLAMLMMTVKDPKLDEFVDQLENGFFPKETHSDSIQLRGRAKLGSRRGSNILKLPSSESPQVIIQMNSAINQMEPLTLVDFQIFFETVVIPRLDTALANLEEIIKFPNFEFNVELDGKLTQLDLGEVGPLLAGTKYLKIISLMVVSRNLEPVLLNGSMDWATTLDSIDDFTYLSVEEKQAMDHFTGLFHKDNPFLNLRTQWQTQYTGIPNIILTAMVNVQTGLQFGLTEAQSGNATQINDPYIVGYGTEADISPTDVANWINDLERFKKYFMGPVTMNYSNGTRSITVDFTKLFQINNPQALLPYHKINDYSLWEDTISVDTMYSTQINSYSESGSEILDQLNFPNPNNNYSYYAPYYTFRTWGDQTLILEGSSGLFPDTLGILINQAGTCNFAYQIFKTPTLNEFGQYVNLPSPALGTFSLQSCNNSLGINQYINYISVDIDFVPFYFTNIAGTKTLTPGDRIDGPRELTGRVIFPDPTFNGVLPGMTNELIWDTFDTFESISPNLDYECEIWTFDPVSGGYTTQILILGEDERHNYNYNYCKALRPELNASDLDILMFYLNS